MTETARQKQQREVDRNYAFLMENYVAIAKENSGKNFLLLKNQKVIGGFVSWEDAKEAARLLYKGKERYSIQELSSRPINLGYQAYAVL